MPIDEILQKIYDLPLSTAIREGTSLFPWIESLHVLCVVTVVGTIAIVDLRLLGIPSHTRSARQLIDQLLPFTWVAFAGAVVFGTLLFCSNAINYFHNWDFQMKMLMMALAGVNMIVFHLLTQRSMHVWDEASATPTMAKAAGFSSLALWLAVICFGRWVGFTLGAAPF